MPTPPGPEVAVPFKIVSMNALKVATAHIGAESVCITVSAIGLRWKRQGAIKKPKSLKKFENVWKNS